MSESNQRMPLGSQGVPLSQSFGVNHELYVTLVGGAHLDVDVIDRAARLLGLVSPVPASVWDVSDRAARLLGIIYGNQAALQQVPVTLELITQDTGLHTNPERWLHLYHWNTPAEVTIAAAGAGGEQNLGGAVGAGLVRRIREVTVKHAGSNNPTVTNYDANGGNLILTIDVPAQSTKLWSSQDGREVAATLQPVIQTSDVVGGSTYVSAAGVECAQV